MKTKYIPGPPGPCGPQGADGAVGPAGRDGVAVSPEITAAVIALANAAELNAEAIRATATALDTSLRPRSLCALHAGGVQ